MPDILKNGQIETKLRFEQTHIVNLMWLHFWYSARFARYHHGESRPPIIRAFGFCQPAMQVFYCYLLQICAVLLLDVFLGIYAECWGKHLMWVGELSHHLSSWEQKGIITREGFSICHVAGGLVRPKHHRGQPHLTWISFQSHHTVVKTGRFWRLFANSHQIFCWRIRMPQWNNQLDWKRVAPVSSPNIVESHKNASNGAGRTASSN